MKPFGPWLNLVAFTIAVAAAVKLFELGDPVEALFFAALAVMNGVIFLREHGRPRISK